MSEPMEIDGSERKKKKKTKKERKGAGLEGYVFHFNDRPALSCQDNTVCVGLMKDFMDAIHAEQKLILERGGRVAASVTGFSDIVSDALGKYRIEWLAAYGCAVLIKKVGALSSFVTVVGLDGWKTRVHASVLGRQITTIPKFEAPAVMEIGLVPQEKTEELLTAWRGIMEQDPQHGQKSPSFAWARLLQAAQGLKLFSAEKVMQKEAGNEGGAAGVGRHGDSPPRNTAFPLVASVLSTVLDQTDNNQGDTFHRCLALYYLHILR